MDLVVARVGRPHGVHGAVSVEVRTDDPQGRLAPGVTLRTDPTAAGPLTVAAARLHSGRLLLNFVGYADRPAAEALRGVLLLAEVDPSQRLPDAEEFLDVQLVGLAVRTVAGRDVGRVVEVLHLPGQDVLVVRRAHDPESPEVLVPFVAALVPEVDLDAGLVVVDPPPGLVPDED